ncbi:MAG: hypothetical protein KF726_19480 [Anaerolineae bacterium]|nr:hypothetical protein [Anaerolineae bacterium]
MSDVFNEMVHGWQNFYFMVGGAAAALMGLMFVALSLGSHLVERTTQEQIGAFVTPSILYFVSVLLLACIMLIPTFSPLGLAVLLAAGAAIGLQRTVFHVRALVRTALKVGDFDRWDWLSGIIFPPLSYALVLIAAVLLLLNVWSVALLDLWLVVILLFVCAISNTWALVLWIVEQR